MLKVVVCFTGFRDREYLNSLAVKIRWMGGAVRKNMAGDVTHLVAYQKAGNKVFEAMKHPEKYEIMRGSWINQAWAMRNKTSFIDANDAQFRAIHKSSLFQNTCLAFIGFHKSEHGYQELIKMTRSQGGIIAHDLNDKRLTHVIVSDQWSDSNDIDMLQTLLIPDLKISLNKQDNETSKGTIESIDENDNVTGAYRVPVLRLEWFWKSVQHTVLCSIENFIFVPNHNFEGKLEEKSMNIDSIYIHRDNSYLEQVTEESEVLDQENEKENVAPSKKSFIDASNLQLNNSQNKNSLIINNRRTSNGRHSIHRTSLLNNLSGSNCMSPEIRYIDHKGNLSNSLIEAQLSSLSFTSPKHDKSSKLSFSLYFSDHSNSSLLRRTPSKQNVSQSTPLKTKLEKRQYRVFEFFTTENNYLEILAFLTKTVYSQIIDNEQIGGAILPVKEADIVFGKLFQIHDLHEKISLELTRLKNEWSMDASCLASVLYPFLEEIERVYAPYMEFYSAAHLRFLGEQHPRFLAFMRQVEKRKESGRQSLNDLLVRPVQRLPSMQLLMEGILKFTPSSHPDHDGMKDILKKLSFTLETINDRLKKNEEHFSLWNLYNDISGAPPEMLSSSRSLLAQLDAFEICSTDGDEKLKLSPVTLFLLTDMLEIVVPRRRGTGEPMTHAIKGALSAINGDSDVPISEVESNNKPGGGGGQVSHSNSLKSANTSANSSGFVSRKGSGASTKNYVTRKGSGSSSIASNLFSAFTSETKHRPAYKHLKSINLVHVKKLIDLCCDPISLAAFGLVVSKECEVQESLHGFCLAASLTANFAKQSGKCPSAVEAAVLASQQSSTKLCLPTEVNTRSSSTKLNMNPTSSNTNLSEMNQACASTLSLPKESSVSVDALQTKVSELKASFLKKLSQQIIQVSCISHSPEDLLVMVDFESAFHQSVDKLFESAANGFKSKKFRRQIGRNISIKTPRKQMFQTGNVNGREDFSGHPHQIGGNDHYSFINQIGSALAHVQSDMRLLIPHTPGKSKISMSGDPILTNSSTYISNEDQLKASSTPNKYGEDFHEIETSDYEDNYGHEGDETPNLQRKDIKIRNIYSDDFDNISLASSCMGPNHWPAYPFDEMIRQRCTLADATNSSTSLRSISSKKSLKPFMLGRTSVSAFTRKSVCQSVLAGLKNIRKSIAGGGSFNNYRTSNKILRDCGNPDEDEYYVDYCDGNGSEYYDEYSSNNKNSGEDTICNQMNHNSKSPYDFTMTNLESTLTTNRIKFHGSTPNLSKRDSRTDLFRRPKIDEDKAGTMKQVSKTRLGWFKKK